MEYNRKYRRYIYIFLDIVAISSDDEFLSINSYSLPYQFTFDFDSNLKSQTFNVTSSTVRIYAQGEWEDPDAEAEWLNTEYNYFDITLYSNSGTNYGTVRYTPNGILQYGQWTNLPSGDYYFYMSKHRITWSNPNTGYNGDIVGSGEVRQY